MNYYPLDKKISFFIKLDVEIILQRNLYIFVFT